jgi:ATP-binding cassette, subfamily B (MDR/TAP), member 1
MEKATVDISPVPVTERNAPPIETKMAAESQEDKENYSSKSEYKASFSQYVRIFSYSTIGDRFLMAAAGISSIGAGVTLPIMIVVFGRFFGTSIDYFIPGTNVTKDQFLATVNTNTYRRRIPFKSMLSSDWVILDYILFTCSSPDLSSAIFPCLRFA